MNLETRIRDLFPPAKRSGRDGDLWDVSEATNNLLSLVTELDSPLSFRVLTENDRSVLAFRLGDELESFHALEDRYAYTLRLIMAHLSVKLSESTSKQLSPYEGSGEMRINGQRIEIEYCNKPGQLCLHFETIQSECKINRKLMAVG